MTLTQVFRKRASQLFRGLRLLGYGSMLYNSAHYYQSELADIDLVSIIYGGHNVNISDIINPLQSVEVHTQPPGTSIAFFDNRKPVMISEKQYHSIGIVANKTSLCTATYVKIDGYETVSGNGLAVTAAHCLKDYQPLLFLFDYTKADGTRDILEALFSNIKSFEDDNSIVFNDIALIEMNTSITPDIQPLKLSLSGKMENNSRAYGYSADTIGLTSSFCSKAKPITPYYYTARCDLTSGASGGPIITLKNGKPIVQGVNSSAGIESILRDPASRILPSYSRTTHATITRDMVETVPFIRKKAVLNPF